MMHGTFNDVEPLKPIILDKNIGKIQRDVSTARRVSYIVIAVFVTFALLSMGMCALWCRRQYKKHFIEGRRQRENYDEIISGQVHHGMYKNEQGDWEVVEPGGGPTVEYDENDIPYVN